MITATRSRGHGRCLHRRIQVCHPGRSLIQQWMGLPLLVVVERWGIRQNQPFRQRQFYISSLATSAHALPKLSKGIGASKINCIGSRMSRYKKMLHPTSPKAQRQIGQLCALSSSPLLDA